MHRAEVITSKESHNAPVTAEEKRIRPALQARSQATQQRILDVVDKLVRQGRYDTATITDITRAAKCSVGAFYGRFSDKDAALLSFYERRCDVLEEAVLAIIGKPPSTPLRKLLRDLIDVLVGHSIEYREFLIAFQSRFTSGDTEFLARTRKMNLRLIDALTRALKLRSDQFRHPDPRSAALFTLAMIGGLTRDVILHGARIVEGHGLTSEFADELERAVTGYLDCRQVPKTTEA